MMDQVRTSDSAYFSPRPHHASLLPLAPANQVKPPAEEALSKLPKPILRPFKDIIPDARLDCWTRSIHVYPAAYPRSLSGSSVHEALLPKCPHSRRPDEQLAKDIRMQNLSAQRRFENSQVDEPQLFLVAARYFVNSELEECQSAPANDDESITLIFFVPNGLHKETYEPMLAHLLVSPAGKKVREVWAVDGAQYGDSAMLNRPNLGITMDGADYARDVLNLILFYLPDGNSCRSARIPLVLPRLECPDGSFCLLDKSVPSAGHNKPVCWRNRQLALSGQSMGGTIAVLAATSIPELFHHVILVDPVLSPIQDFCILHLSHYSSAAICRRDQWESPEAALENFQQRRGRFSAWDPAALRRYVQNGLDSSQPTKLKCHKLHEASAAMDAQNRVSESYHRLCNYYHDGHQPPFHLCLILANPSQSTFPKRSLEQSPLIRRDRVSVKQEHLGHLMVQENPRQVASLISESLLKPINPQLRSRGNFEHHTAKL